MTDETPELRELTLTQLGPEGATAKLTLSDKSLIIETSDNSPLPEWLRGEIPLEELDIAYIDPQKELERARAAGEEDAEDLEEPQVSPGFRLARWIEIKKEDTGEVFDRRGMFLCDEGHVDLGAAERFALTFRQLAGRPLPGEEKEPVVSEEAPVEEPAPAPEAAAPVAEVAEETMAFAGSDAFAPPDDEEPEEKAFVQE